MKSKIFKISCIVGAFAIVLLVILLIVPVRVVETGRHPPELRHYISLQSFATYVSEAKPLPAGDIHSLEEWLARRMQSVRFEAEMVDILFMSGIQHPIVSISDDGRVSIQDMWGQKLIYEYPSSDPEYTFRLYSIGPDGIDQRGRGDDLDVSRKLQPTTYLDDDNN